jgi:hypothetical protein
MTNSEEENTVPTEGEAELMSTLERVAREGRAQCRLCDHWVEGEHFGEIFEKLAEHGEEAHDWGGPRDGWST